LRRRAIRCQGAKAAGEDAAMIAQPRFCGRCGNPVAPGAPYCGRCGAPQVPVAVAAQPGYSYPLSAPRPPSGFGRVSAGQLAIAAGLLIILAVTTMAVTAFAVSRVINPHKTCTANCGAKIVTPLPESNTYRSSTYRYEVDYSSEWKVRSQDGSSLTLGTKIGLVQVTGMKTKDGAGIVILNTVAALPNAEWQDVTRVSDLKGAHLGDQDGTGAVYSANLVGANAKATKVRFVVIVASRSGVTVVFFAANPADTKNFPNGIPEGQQFDYVCQEFRWGS